ncbi:putative PEP-binding protein [Thiobacter aerophilum]|uniref:PEP-binding protein n=1 Tax=Thiobacter aerophilum TaxID=3121275 RepID=A0ABV0EAR9_9BURK
MKLALIPFVPGQAHGRLVRGLAPISEPHIAVLDSRSLEAPGLAPTPHLRGLVVVEAAPLAHPVLRLRGWGLPIVLARETNLPWGEMVWLDAAQGRLATTPLPSPPALPPAPADLCTADGRAVTLLASVGSGEAARLAMAQGARGIGLFRSEYVVAQDGQAPDASLFEARLRAVCEAAAGCPVTVRLLDVAGDKHPPWLPDLPGVSATLGVQGVRLYRYQLARRVVRAELAAIARLAPMFPLRILLPYVTRREEVETWVQEVRQATGLDADKLPVGTMLETPAAALAVDSLLEVAAFAALGCNDLMQCLFAANRDEAAVADQLDFHSPVLYRFLAHVVEHAGNAERLQVNGLLSQWPGVIVLLLGLGFRRFSVDPALLPWLAARITKVNVAQAAKLAKAACRARHAAEVCALLAQDDVGA